MDFSNKKIVIMGLGLNNGGVGTAKFFCKQKAEVLVTDLKTKKQLKESIDKLKGLPIKYILGKHRKEDFENADLIIKNPDVPQDSVYLKIAKKKNITIETDINLFFKLSGAYIIGITGTKGKSTISTLIYKLLKSKYKNTFLAGNIGISPLEMLSKVKKGDKVVLELSSFELEDLEISPQIAIFSNILKDHLNRYKNINKYIEAKKNIFKYQNKNDILILNYDNLKTRELSKLANSKVYFYSIKHAEDRPLQILGCYLNNQKIFFNNEKKPILNVRDIKLYGEHNLSNILSAISCAKILKVSNNEIEKNIKKFRGIANRQEFIKENRGVKYFNDTTATMPDAVEQALRTMRERFFESKIVLIAGGQDKKLNFNVLKEKPDFLVLLPGTASEKIKNKFNVKTFLVESMEQAVKKADQLSEKGDIVLLSPGSASFNLFKNEFHRGKEFIKYVNQL
ncbi:MAG: UDP-N-acetylmuramoyl-L-alanine--D-glutamate ligase [Candidatus Nealsonbacteria bacterium]